MNGIEVADGPDVDLRAGKEGIDAQEIDHDTALDAADAAALQDFAGLERLRDTFPDAHEVRALAREDQLAVLVLHALEEDFDLIADLQIIPVREFGERDTSLRT